MGKPKTRQCRAPQIVPGDAALDLLDAIPRSRINDVCYLDVAETERPVGFNPATRIAPGRRALAAAGIV
jgi:hypothetical protein